LSTIGAWCFHKLSFSLAAFSAIGRLGSIVNNVLLPYLFQKTGNISTGPFIGFFISILMLASALFVVFLEKWSISRNLFKDLSPRRRVQRSFLEEIAELQLVFWVLCLICGLFEASKNSFNYISSDLFQTRFNFSSQTAGWLIVFFSQFFIIHSQFHYSWSLCLTHF